MASKDSIHVTHGRYPTPTHKNSTRASHLICGAIPIQSQRDATVVPVLMRECQSRAKRGLRAHNAVAAVKVGLRAVHVHRPALALCRTDVPWGRAWSARRAGRRGLGGAGAGVLRSPRRERACGRHSPKEWLAG